VTINVLPDSNDPPVANDDSATTEEDTPITIDVIAGNDPPVAVNDSVTTNEDTPVVIDALLMDNGLGVDSDPNGDTLTPLSVTAPANGNAIVNTDGTFEYTPNAGFFGLDSFVYTISDGNAGTATATGM